MLDRLTAQGGGLERALEPGGLVDQLLDEDGLVERLLAEDGLADRLLAKDGLLDKLTARNGPLEQLELVADTLNRLAPGLEALAPTIDLLRDAVDTLSTVVDPLSNIADRIPLMPRRRRPRSPRAVSSERVVTSERWSPTPNGWPPTTTSDPIRFPGALCWVRRLLSSVVEHSPCKRAVVSSILTGGPLERLSPVDMPPGCTANVFDDGVH